MSDIDLKWDNKQKLKQEIQTIMNDALAGYIDLYKYKAKDGRTYIRWGLVQKHIDEAIELYWPKGEIDE